MPYLPKPKPRTAFARRKNTDRPYNSKQWRNLSKRFLAAHPICVECEKNGKVKAASVTDHISHDQFDFFDESGLQALCHKCHNSKSGKEAHKMKVYLGDKLLHESGENEALPVPSDGRWQYIGIEDGKMIFRCAVEEIRIPHNTLFVDLNPGDYVGIKYELGKEAHK